MKLQIKSDLHLDVSEYWNRKREDEPGNSDVYVHPQADVLILAGDIVEQDLELYNKHFEHITRPVLYVPGNHEYHFGDVDQTPANLKKFFRASNVHVLDRDFYIQGDVMFIGATLWTPLNSQNYQEAGNMVRWHACAGMDAKWWGTAFQKDFHFIKSMLESPKYSGYKKVVLTHFLPLMDSIPKRFEHSPLNAYFASSDCEELMLGCTAPKIWVHGHTHDSFDYKKHETKIICNPYGSFKRDVNPNFNPELIVEV